MVKLTTETTTDSLNMTNDGMMADTSMNNMDNMNRMDTSRTMMDTTSRMNEGRMADSAR